MREGSKNESYSGAQEDNMWIIDTFFVVVVFNILLDLKIIVLFSILKMVGVGGVLEKKLCLCSWICLKKPNSGGWGRWWTGHCCFKPFSLTENEGVDFNRTEVSVAVADCVCVWCCADGTPSATLQLLCRLATPLSQMHEDGHWAARKATQSSSTPASHSQTPSVSHTRFLSLMVFWAYKSKYCPFCL